MSQAAESSTAAAVLRGRAPKQLLFALFGEYVVDGHDLPIRTSALIGILERAGVSAPTTRATLDRLTQSGFLERERRGRELLFSLAPGGRSVLMEASERVRGHEPFLANGEGWTLVTFTIPEDQRRLRHRLRAALTWDGFAPIRDGLWLAPGEVDVETALSPMRDDLPDGSVVAFHARELPGFPITDGVQSAWDIPALRAAHLAFIDEWSSPPDVGALATRIMLVADWVALLRADPRLPTRFMDADWPSVRSTEVYHRVRARLADDAASEFATLVADR